MLEADIHAPFTERSATADWLIMLMGSNLWPPEMLFVMPVVRVSASCRHNQVAQNLSVLNEERPSWLRAKFCCDDSRDIFAGLRLDQSP